MQGGKELAVVLSRGGGRCLLGLLRLLRLLRRHACHQLLQRQSKLRLLTVLLLHRRLLRHLPVELSLLLLLLLLLLLSLRLLLRLLLLLLRLLLLLLLLRLHALLQC